MKFKSLAFALTLLAGNSAMAACTETFNLGVMGPPALRVIGNDFRSTQRFEDCYNFTIGGPANAFGLTFEFDGSVRRNIDLTSITLSGGSLAQSISDTSTGSFSFSSLLAGAYQLVVMGNVSGRNGGFLGGGWVGYTGALATTAAAGVTPPVPEPETYAMLAIGLLAVGSVMRKRNQQA